MNQWQFACQLPDLKQFLRKLKVKIDGTISGVFLPEQMKYDPVHNKEVNLIFAEHIILK